jgi:hypothetical protein
MSSTTIEHLPPASDITAVSQRSHMSHPLKKADIELPRWEDQKKMFRLKRADLSGGSQEPHRAASEVRTCCPTPAFLRFFTVFSNTHLLRTAIYSKISTIYSKTQIVGTLFLRTFEWVSELYCPTSPPPVGAPHKDVWGTNWSRPQLSSCLDCLTFCHLRGP